jgi:hypothetical protein
VPSKQTLCGVTALAMLVLAPSLPTNAQIISHPIARAPAGSAPVRSGNGAIGFWNIYASIDGGDVWDGDKVGTDPVARRLERQGQAVVLTLRRCGIAAELDDSSDFPNFRRNLLIVHTGPFPSAQLAGMELARAKTCGVVGYSKFSRKVQPGPGED